MLRRDINLRCNPCTIEASVSTLSSVSGPHIVPISTIQEVVQLLPLMPHPHSMWWNLSNTIALDGFHWYYMQILRFDTSSNRSSDILTPDQCILYVSSFCYGSCASLCIIDVSRDWIVKNIVESNERVQKTVETIKIWRNNRQETSAVNWRIYLNKFL